METYQKLCEIAGKENVLCQEALKKHTSFRIGGAAKYFITPDKIDALIAVTEYCRREGIAYSVLGNGTNILASDSGFDGVILQIQKNFDECKIEGKRIYAGAGILLSKLSAMALKEGLAGLEFASGIPGTLGGAVVMNAGAYGGEIKDVLKEVTLYKPGIGLEKLSAEELKLEYRSSVVKNTDWIVLQAVLELTEGKKEEIAEKIESFRASRAEKQPLELPSAGSAFKRPEGYFAGKLIMDAGLRGYAIGDAAVSQKHCGFFVNLGNASATDMKQLFDEVIEEVYQKFGVKLEPEVRFLGKF